jgi:hypothetical protein
MRRPTKIAGTHRAGGQEHEIGVSVISIGRDDKAVVADSFSTRPAQRPITPSYGDCDFTDDRCDVSKKGRRRTSAT